MTKQLKKIEKINFDEVFNDCMNFAHSKDNADYRMKKALAEKLNEIIERLNSN
jgi:hypothetical protein